MQSRDRPPQRKAPQVGGGCEGALAAPPQAGTAPSSGHWGSPRRGDSPKAKQGCHHPPHQATAGPLCPEPRGGSSTHHPPSWHCTTMGRWGGQNCSFSLNRGAPPGQKYPPRAPLRIEIFPPRPKLPPRDSSADKRVPPRAAPLPRAFL